MIVIKDILNKGKGVFASSFIKRNSVVYESCRLHIPKDVLLAILKLNSFKENQKLISWGWACDANTFIAVQGVEGFINHSDDPNCDDGVAIRDIQSGEEITENYHMYDIQEPWYVELTREYNVWIPQKLKC
jgi:hypothetical protein